MKFRAPLQSVKHLSDNKIPLCFDFVLTLCFLLGVLRVAMLVHPICLADSNLGLKLAIQNYIKVPYIPVPAPGKRQISRSNSEPASEI